MLDQVGGRDVGGPGGRDHGERDRVALLVDRWRRHLEHAGRRAERVLEFHQPRVGTAGIAASVGELVGELLLQCQGLFLLVLRLLLLSLQAVTLALQRIGLLLQGRALGLERGGLLLQGRPLDAERVGLLLQRRSLGLQRAACRRSSAARAWSCWACRASAAACCSRRASWASLAASAPRTAVSRCLTPASSLSSSGQGGLPGLAAQSCAANCVSTMSAVRTSLARPTGAPVRSAA